jgi:hypothetical protein
MNGRPGVKAFMILRKGYSNNMEPPTRIDWIVEIMLDKFHYGINYPANRIAFEKPVFYNFIIQRKLNLLRRFHG